MFKGGDMGEGSSRLRDRMLRDAVVEVLQGTPGTNRQEAGWEVGVGRVGGVTVDGDRARVVLVLTTGWCPAAPSLVTEVARRLQSLAEVARFEVTVVWQRNAMK
jgi:hypothetical protein